MGKTTLIPRRFMKPLHLTTIAMILFSSCTSVKSTYTNEVEQEIRVNAVESAKAITEVDIAHLPTPVQNHLRACGFINKPMPLNGRITWANVQFKMSPEKQWIPIKCLQFNSVKQPARFAYLYAPKLGVNIFVGRDKYQNGEGNMLIKLLGILTLQNVKGKEMDESSLVTILSEALFVPGYALQPYIKWEPVDSTSAKASIEYNGISVSGTYFFNSQGLFDRFESNDRNMQDKDSSIKVKWSVTIDYYKKNGDYTIPSYAKAAWHLPAGDYEYFKGEVAGITFNEQPIAIP